MAKNLMIVESPAKAKTIEKILGKDFHVTSCYGHVRDLLSNKLSVDTAANYKPHFEVPKEKEKVVKELKKLAKEAEKVWLATDEDREGEAIAWHLAELLGIKNDDVARIAFHEITKKAILEAVENPGKVNIDLVNAQLARRILDRLVGFELSPVLWKKMNFKNALSAGRVQSVAVRLIVEKEREIKEFTVKSVFKVYGIFEVSDGNGGAKKFKALLSKNFNTEKEAHEFLSKCIGATYTIRDIQVKPAKRSPNAPFTTSTLQQEASRKLGYSVSRTMTVAQKLYEAGKITYMRTDSVNLSETAMEDLQKAISTNYGDEYVFARQYKTKTASAQEAHEAIRPTYIDKKEVEGDSGEQKLYDLIWKRTISSQMADAQIERTTGTIEISSLEELFVAKGEVLKFDGFLKVYVESTDDEEEDEDSIILPNLHIGQVLAMDEIQATERFSRPPARFAEASLVRKLEELGIGRPSTYAPTISTIQNRKYVIKELREGNERKFKALCLKGDMINTETRTEITGAEKGKLYPTDIGMLVNDFLVEHFKRVMDFSFTAKIEKEFDEIANGNEEWVKMIDEFYKPFHENVEHTTENADRITGERALGTDPKSGKPIIARVARYGPIVQLGSMDDEEKPKFAKIKAPATLETVTLEQALEYFKLPRNLGEYENLEVIVAEGRYGPYVQHNGKFYSLGKDNDPLTIMLDKAIEVIKVKKEEQAKKLIKEFKEEKIQIVKGPYGPYIKANGKNVRIPKGEEPEDLTLERCQELIEKAPTRKRRFVKKKKDA